MIKHKTHSGAKKRFNKLKSGLIKRAKAFRRHLLTGKTSKTKRNLRKGAYICSSDVNHLKSIL